MKSHAWDQFLVVTECMNPTESQLCRQGIELGGIVAQEQVDHRVDGLSSVGCYCQSLFDALAQIHSKFGQVRIENLVEVFFREVNVGGQQERKQACPLVGDSNL